MKFVILQQLEKLIHIVELDGNIFITAQHNENVI